MYVALEGVKGTGKTTLVEVLQQRLASKKLNVSKFALTERVEDSWAESSFSLAQRLNLRINRLKQKVYLNRAKKNLEKCNLDADVILGDRSILTCFASRMTDINEFKVDIEKIRHQYKFLPKPRIIIYLGCRSLINSHELRMRKKSEQKSDCDPSALEFSHLAYQYILSNLKVFDKSETKVYRIEHTSLAARLEAIEEIILKHLEQ